MGVYRLWLYPIVHGHWIAVLYCIGVFDQASCILNQTLNKSIYTLRASTLMHAAFEDNS